MRFDKKNRLDKESHSSRSPSDSHLRDSSVEEAQEQWNRSMREKTTRSLDSSWIEKESSQSKESDFSSVENSPYIPSPEEPVSKIEESNIKYATSQQVSRNNSSYSSAGNEQKALWEQEEKSKKAEKENLLDSLLSSEKTSSSFESGLDPSPLFQDDKKNDMFYEQEDDILSSTGEVSSSPTEELITGQRSFSKDIFDRDPFSSFSRNEPTALSHEETSTSPFGSAESEENQAMSSLESPLYREADRSFDISKSHLRDSSTEEAQNRWKQEMSRAPEQVASRPFSENTMGKSEDFMSNLSEKETNSFSSDQSYSKPKTAEDNLSYNTSKTAESEKTSRYNFETEKSESDSFSFNSGFEGRDQSHLRDSKMQSEQNLWNEEMQKKSAYTTDSSLFSESAREESNSYKMDPSHKVDPFEQKSLFEDKGGQSNFAEQSRYSSSFQREQSHLRTTGLQEHQEEWEQKMQKRPESDSFFTPISEESTTPQSSEPLRSEEKDRQKTRFEQEALDKGMTDSKIAESSFTKDSRSFSSGYDSDLASVKQDPISEPARSYNENDSKRRSHLRDTDLQTEQEKWNRTMQEKPESNSFSSITSEKESFSFSTESEKTMEDLRSSREQSMSTRASNISKDFDQLKSHKDAMTNLSQETVRFAFQESQGNESYRTKSSHLRDTGLQTEQEKWDQAMQKKPESNSFSSVAADKESFSFSTKPEQSTEPSKSNIETNRRDFSQDATLIKNRKEVMSDLGKEATKSSFQESQTQESYRSKRCHLRDTGLQTEQEKWDRAMQKKPESDSFSSITSDKAGFTSEPSIGKKATESVSTRKTHTENGYISSKDSEISRNGKEMMKDLSENAVKESVRELKETSDTYRSKQSHLRDSALQSEQEKWERKMQKRPDSDAKTVDIEPQKGLFNESDSVKPIPSSDKRREQRQDFIKESSVFDNPHKKKDSGSKEFNKKESNPVSGISSSTILKEPSDEKKAATRTTSTSHLRDSVERTQQELWKQEIERKNAGKNRAMPKDLASEDNPLKNSIPFSTEKHKEKNEPVPEENTGYQKNKKTISHEAEASVNEKAHGKKSAGYPATENEVEKGVKIARPDAKEETMSTKDSVSKAGKVTDSHLRESVMQAEQNIWKEKMHEKEENLSRRKPVGKDKDSVPLSKTDKKEITEDEKPDRKRSAAEKREAATKEKKGKALEKAKKGELSDEKEKKEESLEELIKKRNDTQKKALAAPTAYTLEKFSRFSTNSLHKILAKQKQVLRNGKDFLWRNSAAQTDTGRGVKESVDNFKPFVDMAVDTAKRSLASSIMGDMTNDKKFQEAYEAFKKKFNAIEEYKFKMDGKNVLGSQKYKNLIHVDPTKVMTRQEWKILQNDIRKILRDRGFGDFSANPILMKLQIAKAIRAGKFTEEEAKILKVLSGRIAEIGSLSGRSNIYHMMRFARRKLHKYGRQESTMNAIFLTKAFVQHVASTVKNALSVVKTAAFLTKNAAKLASLAAAKASAKISETKLAKKVADKLPDGVKATHSEIKKQRAKFKDAKKKVERKKNRIRDSIDVIVDKVPHPVKAVKMKFERAKSEVFGFITRGKYNPLRYIAKAFSITQQAKTVMLCAIAGFFLFYIIVVALILIIAAMTGQYTMETNETKTNEYCLKKIEQLYQEQQNSLAAYDSGGAYRNVTINKVDKKSNAIYDEGLDFEETTNTAEMMSMAQVYFDFELDDAKQETVEAYLTGLYYGSHTTDIKETKHYTKDEDGNKVLDYTDADITVTTYYFDDLFDCALTSSGMFGSESAMAGQAFDIPQTFNQMWTVTKYDAINWGYDCGKLYNAWKAAGSQWDDGFACLNINGKSYRFIAVLEKFGKVGDYMTVQLDNGTNINCIVADTKRASECPNGWGHAEGNTVSVVEWEVSTAYFNRYGNPGSGYGKELHGRKAAKLINGGSYFKNPGGPSFTSSPVLDSSTGLTSNANTFFTLLNKYSDFIKQNSNYVRYGNSNNVKTYAQAKSNAEDHEKSTINCVSPIMWGLKEMGLLRKSTNFYSTTSGTWMGKGDSLTEKTTIISSGEPIGMNVITAAKKGLLKPGDIIANKSFNHTYVYVSYDEANQNIVVYEAGGNARNQGYSKVGCGPFSDKQYKNLKIASIIRWR